MALTEAQIMDFLHQIEEGTVTLRCEGDKQPQNTYAGNVHYLASNGWKIVIFNDCNEWDYIDSITDADGNEMDYEALYPMDELGLPYAPTDEVAWRCYGIPGYLEHREERWKGGS